MPQRLKQELKESPASMSYAEGSSSAMLASSWSGWTSGENVLVKRYYRLHDVAKDAPVYIAGTLN